MFFKVSSLTYHSPITIGLLTYGGLLGTLGYALPALLNQGE
jgi:hypothetical protein